MDETYIKNILTILGVSRNQNFKNIDEMRHYLKIRLYNCKAEVLLAIPQFYKIILISDDLY